MPKTLDNLFQEIDQAFALADDLKQKLFEIHCEAGAAAEVARMEMESAPTEPTAAASAE